MTWLGTREQVATPGPTVFQYALGSRTPSRQPDADHYDIPKPVAAIISFVDNIVPEDYGGARWPGHLCTGAVIAVSRFPPAIAGACWHIFDRDFHDITVCRTTVLLIFEIGCDRRGVLIGDVSIFKTSPSLKPTFRTVACHQCSFAPIWARGRCSWRLRSGAAAGVAPMPYPPRGVIDLVHNIYALFVIA